MFIEMQRMFGVIDESTISRKCSSKPTAAECTMPQASMMDRTLVDDSSLARRHLSSGLNEAVRNLHRWQYRHAVVIQITQLLSLGEVLVWAP